jgi:hypothetical protein
MPEARHAVDKVQGCDIEGCKSQAERSISGKKVEKAGLTLSADPEKAVHLCRDHYREYKKRSKKDRTLEMLGW